MITSQVYVASTFCQCKSFVFW